MDADTSQLLPTVSKNIPAKNFRSSKKNSAAGEISKSWQNIRTLANKHLTNMIKSCLLRRSWIEIENNSM
jgi:hypothetical protein